MTARAAVNGTLIEIRRGSDGEGVCRIHNGRWQVRNNFGAAADTAWSDLRTADNTFFTAAADDELAMVIEESGGDGTGTNLNIVPVLKQGTNYHQCNDQLIANSAGYTLNEIHPENLSGGTNVKEIKVVGTTRPYRHSDIEALMRMSPRNGGPVGSGLHHRGIHCGGLHQAV